MVEFKTAIPSIHYSRIKRQSFDPAYKWQLVGNLMITGRNWIDFVSFCPDFPVSKRLYTYRCYASSFEREFRQADTKINLFRKVIAEAKESIMGLSYLNTGDE
jgi:hypothetical protein